MTTRPRLCLLATLGLLTLAGCHTRPGITVVAATAPRPDRLVNVTLDLCPEPVQKAFVAEHGKLGEIVCYTERAQTVYAVRIMLDNGPEWLKVAADGSRLLLSYEPLEAFRRPAQGAATALRECPKEVQETIARQVGEEVLGPIVLRHEDGHAQFEVELASNGRISRLTIDADGTLLAEDFGPTTAAAPPGREDVADGPFSGRFSMIDDLKDATEIPLQECPRKVQETFRDEAHGEALARVLKRLVDNRTLYRAEIRDHGGVHWLEVAEDGTPHGSGFYSDKGLFGGGDSSLDAVPATAPAIRPQLAKVTLVAGDTTLRNPQFAMPWTPEYAVGKQRFWVTDDAVAAFDAQYRPLWLAKPPAGRRVQWVTEDGTVAYFQAFTPGKAFLAEDSWDTPAPENPTQLRRLDLAKGRWLAPLLLPADPKLPARANIFTAALATPEGLAVVTHQPQSEDREAAKTEARATYRVSLFKPGQDKPQWVRDFAARSARPEPGVRLLAAVMPDYAGADIQALAWIKGGLLVCAGEKENVMLLDAAGKTKWELKDLWEYQRGFIGPSVWAHRIARFGLDDDDEQERDEKGWTPDQKKYAEEARQRIRTARADFEKQFECAIVGGPVVVPLPQPGDPDHVRIFVAVARGPKEWNWGYLSDCLVYELDGEGKVQAMATLPRMVIGSAFQRMPDGLVWACRQGAMLRLTGGSSAGSSPGSADLLCPIPWYRQFDKTEVQAWLSTGPAGDPLAMGPTVAFRVHSGGYISRKGDNVYHFPLSMIDLKSGVERTFELRVPFESDVTLPTANYGATFGRIYTRGPHLLGITRLQLRQSTLEITLGMEKSAGSVTFDLKALNVGQ